MNTSTVSHLQVFVTVTLQGAGLLQVTSDLSQVLYLRLQRLNLTREERFSQQITTREIEVFIDKFSLFALLSFIPAEGG